MSNRFQLIAAPHTPFDDRLELNLQVVEQQIQRLIDTKVDGAFVVGSTGESASLSTAERQQVTERWSELARSTSLKLIVHVGHNSQKEAIELARHAGQLDIDAIAAFAPNYFKPANAADLVEFFAPIAAAAGKPFYYYDIPILTNVHVKMEDFLAIADQIPHFHGLKFTNPNLVDFQFCRNYQNGKYEILFGCDEILLPARSLGAVGAVGSTYNFCAPLYRKLLDAFDRGDVETARQLQWKSVQIISAIARHGFVGAAKQVMSLIGLDCGIVRPPLASLLSAQLAELKSELERIGFFDEVR